VGLASLIICFVDTLTAENSKNSLFSVLAIILAKVVFPDPGGPQKISDGKKIFLLDGVRSLPIIPSLPTKFFCPTKSFKVLGRIISGRGILAIWMVCKKYISPNKNRNKYNYPMLGVRILEERKSKYNKNLKVVKSFGLGTYIQAGGLTQSGGIVESIWRSTLKRIRKQRVKKALILGLGGGSAAKIIRKFWPDAKITGVDIDPVVIDLGKKYLDLAKYNVDVKIGDAYSFPPEGCDLVIVDLYMGDQFPEKFEQGNFLRKLTGCKIVIFNRLYYDGKRSGTVKFGSKLRKIFGKVEYFYPEANLMYICYNN